MFVENVIETQRNGDTHVYNIKYQYYMIFVIISQIVKANKIIPTCNTSQTSRQA